MVAGTRRVSGLREPLAQHRPQLSGSEARRRRRSGIRRDIQWRDPPPSRGRAKARDLVIHAVRRSVLDGETRRRHPRYRPTAVRSRLPSAFPRSEAAHDGAGEGGSEAAPPISKHRSGLPPHRTSVGEDTNPPRASGAAVSITEFALRCGRITPACSNCARWKEIVAGVPSTAAAMRLAGNPAGWPCNRVRTTRRRVPRARAVSTVKAS